LDSEWFFKKIILPKIMKNSHAKREGNFRGALANKENTLEAPLTIKKPSKESPLKRTKKNSQHTPTTFFPSLNNQPQPPWATFFPKPSTPAAVTSSSSRQRLSLPLSQNNLYSSPTMLHQNTLACDQWSPSQ
jgi:hypothetical protein